jgi:hypothetical protein
LLAAGHEAPMNAPAHRPLKEAISALAGTPDDASGIDPLLKQIVQLAAVLIIPVDYASVTAVRRGAPTTVAMNNALALEVDQAQYDNGGGPCLEALTSGIPVRVDAIATTIEWPGFRDVATGIGLAASLSIPLFAGSGLPIAALNMFARDANALAPLSSAVFGSIDLYAEDAQPHAGGLDQGGNELIGGIVAGLAIQRRIQIAIGLIMAGHRLSAKAAYIRLRDRAASSGVSLSQAAEAVTAAAQ